VGAAAMLVSFALALRLGARAVADAS
jgi:hypothetical protein